MSSTNKTSLGLNMWEASDKPVRQDFVNDNVIINEKITKLNSDLNNKANTSDLPSKGVYNGDLNSIPVVANTLTIWLSVPESANAPIASYGLVETIYIDSVSHAIQRFTSWETPNAPRLFIRKKASGTWGGWVEK